MALSHLVVQYESNFCTVALQFIEEEKNYAVPSPATIAGWCCTEASFSLTGSRFDQIWDCFSFIARLVWEILTLLIIFNKWITLVP